MQKTLEKIASDLIQLPKRDRLEIVRFLLFLDNSSSDNSDVSAEWDKEIKDRVTAVISGAAKGIDYEIAKEQLTSRFV